MSSSLQKYLSEWMATEDEEDEGEGDVDDEYGDDHGAFADPPLLDLVCGRNITAAAAARSAQEQHPSLPATSSSTSSVDAVQHGGNRDSKSSASSSWEKRINNNSGTSKSSSGSKPRHHHQLPLPETPTTTRPKNHSGNNNTMNRPMMMNTPPTKLLSSPTVGARTTTTSHQQERTPILSPFSSVFRRRASSQISTFDATSTNTNTNTNANSTADPILQDPHWRGCLSLDESRVVSVVVYVTDPPHSQQQQHHQQQQSSLGRSSSGRTKKMNNDDDLQQQQQRISCVFPFDRLHKVPRTPPRDVGKSTASAEHDTSSPTLACFQGISTTRDLVIVNPTAFGERLPNDVNMEIIRQVAYASAKNHAASGGAYTTEDWARIFRFNQVLWPNHDNHTNSINDYTAASGPLDDDTLGGTARTATTNDGGTTRGLDNLVQAAVNDMVRPASISTRTFVAVSQSGMTNSSNSSSGTNTTNNNNNMSSSASVMSATTFSSVSSSSLLLSSSNPHQVKTLHIFGRIILKSVVQSFATSSALLQQHHHCSTADILSMYGMLGLTVHKLLSSAAVVSTTHTVMLSLLEITPEDTIHDLLWLRSRPLLLTSPPPTAAAQSHTPSSISGKNNTNVSPQRPAKIHKMQDSNRVHLRYSASSSGGGGGGPILEGLEQIPIDSLKSMGHAVRRAFTTSRHLTSNTKGKRRGHVVAMIRLLPVQNNKINGSGSSVSSLSLDNSHCKPPIIQFVDVAVPSTSSSSGNQQNTTTSSSHYTSQSSDSMRRDASIRKATSALHGVLRGLLLRGAGNHVILPFRDSLLTKVLQRSVDRPDVRVCVLTGVSTLTVDYEDSMASLRFASRLLERPGEMPKSPFDTVSRTTTTCSPESSSDEDDYDESSSSDEDDDDGHRRRRRGVNLSHWDAPLRETIVRNITSDPRQRFSKAGVMGTTKRRKKRRQSQQEFLESSDSREVEISQSINPYHVVDLQQEHPLVSNLQQEPVATATTATTITTTTTSTREELKRRLNRLQQVAEQTSSSSSRPVVPTRMAQHLENRHVEGTTVHNIALRRQQQHSDGGSDAAAVATRGQMNTTGGSPVVTTPAINEFLSQSQSALETPIARNSGFRKGLRDYDDGHEQDISNYAYDDLPMQEQLHHDDVRDAVGVVWSSPPRPTIDTSLVKTHHGGANEYFPDDEPSPLTTDTWVVSSAHGATSPPSSHRFHNRYDDGDGYIPLNHHRQDNAGSAMDENVHAEDELYGNEREHVMESRMERQQDRRSSGHVQTTSTITEEEEGIVAALQQQATMSTTATVRLSDSAADRVGTGIENFRETQSNDMEGHIVQPEATMFSPVTDLGQQLQRMSLRSGQDEKDDEDDGNVDPRLLDDLSYELKRRTEFATSDVGDDYLEEYPLPTKEAMDDLSLELFSKPRDNSYQEEGDTQHRFSNFTPAAGETHGARMVSKADSAAAAVVSTTPTNVTVGMSNDGSSNNSVSKEDAASATSSVDRLRRLSWQAGEEEFGTNTGRDETVGSGTNTATRRRLSGIQPPTASPYRNTLGRDASSSPAMFSPTQQHQEQHDNAVFVPRNDEFRAEDEHGDDSRLPSEHPSNDSGSQSHPRLKDPPSGSAHTSTQNHLQNIRHTLEPQEDEQQQQQQQEQQDQHHRLSFENNAQYLAFTRSASGSSSESFNLRSTSSREQAWDDIPSHDEHESGSTRNTENEIQDLTAAIVRVKEQNQQSSKSINQEIQHIERSQDTVIRKLTAERDMAKREIDRRTELQREETMRREQELRELRRQLENSNAQAREFEQLAEAAVDGREGLESTVRELRATLSESVHVDEYRELQQEKEQLAQTLHEAKKQSIERNSDLSDTKLSMKELETEMQSLQKEKSHLMERLSSQTQSIEHLQGEVHKLQSERSALRTKVDRITKEATAVEVKLAETKEKLREARHEKQQLNKQVRDDFESFTKSITQYREKQKEMLREKSEHQAVLADVHKRLDDAHAEVVQLRALADKDRLKLQDELDAFVSNLQIVTGELKIVVAQRDEARSEVEQMSRTLNAATAERDEARFELEATNSARENAEKRISVLKEECQDIKTNIGRSIQNLQEDRNRALDSMHNLQRTIDEQTVTIERLKDDRRRAQEELHDVQQTNERLNRAFQKARQERDDARASLQLQQQQQQPSPEVFGRTVGGSRNTRSTNNNHAGRVARHHDGRRLYSGEPSQMARHSSSRSSPRNDDDNISIVLRQETPMATRPTGSVSNGDNGHPHEIIRQYEEIMARVRDALQEHRNTGPADNDLWTRIYSLEQMLHAHCLSTGSRMHAIEQQQQQQQDQHHQQRRLADSRR